jgi:hypothetical protein
VGIATEIAKVKLLAVIAMEIAVRSKCKSPAATVMEIAR